MSFFETPEIPEGENTFGEEYAQPEWLMAPSNVLPVLVPLELVIGRCADAVVVVSGVRAFTNSWNATLITKRRPGSGGSEWDDPMGFHPMMMHPGMLPPGMPKPDFEQMLRYGFQFSDGSKVTSMGAAGD